MIMPVQAQCQVLRFLTTPSGPAPYITTKLVGLVKFDAMKWWIWGLIGDCTGVNGFFRTGFSLSVLILAALAEVKS